MPDVVPVGEYSGEEWYPGYRPTYGHGPFVIDPVRGFSEADESRFWLTDFHWPQGHTPLNFLVMEDCHIWGTQSAAHMLPLPNGRGASVRVAGIFNYNSENPITSPFELESRGRRCGANLPAFLADFEAIWENRKAELEAGLTHFESLDLSALALPELASLLLDARAFHRRAWEAHFEVMYPLCGAYFGFRGLCVELGLDPDVVPRLFQGYETKILECDRGLWRLTDLARSTGLSGIFAATEPEDLATTLRDAGSTAAPFRSAFDEFLAEFGWRSEGIADVALPSWMEDQTSPLGTIKTFLAVERSHDFEADRSSAADEREAAVDEARSRLTVEEQRAFDAGLASCRAANFAWWNDEHNHYIDLRATIPIRRLALAVAERVEADRLDDTLFLFWPELVALSQERLKWSEVAAMVGERRDYHATWVGRRPTMPKALGTIPDVVLDPLFVEIFGLHHHFLDAIRRDQAGGEAPTTLTGMAASPGVVRGRARVLHAAAELHRIAPGEILVCEATTPNWTPAFGKIAACVCDAGGSLTHASIVSREYRIPCVVGVGMATSSIRDGDEVEVDGTRGIVTVLRR